MAFLPLTRLEQLLLGQKQRGALLGQWNGFGGKVEKGLETIAESAARELEEEAFLSAPLFPVGFIQWVVSSPGEATYRDVMVVFKAHSYTLVDPSMSNPQPDLSMQTSESSTPCSPNTRAQSQQTPRRITEFKASDEMAPAWWDIDALPWDAMRINHKVWYPFMLANRPYRGVYWYQMTRAIAAEGAHNAQRETAQEIWVEDLGKRRFEFGTRSIGVDDKSGVNNDDLRAFAERVGVSGDRYSSGASAQGEAHGKPLEKWEVSKTDPTLNRLIDTDWLLVAITKTEHEWDPKMSCPPPRGH